PKAVRCSRHDLHNSAEARVTVVEKSKAQHP
ncbi:MAG: hypothetical protein QOF59_1988, partial [Actinomycetota bacterium]|nr:hypothetical protein [Actinomycetota bacterium]